MSKRKRASEKRKELQTLQDCKVNSATDRGRRKRIKKKRLRGNRWREVTQKL